MKPNDKAIEAEVIREVKSILNTISPVTDNETIAQNIVGKIISAYAAQFPPSEDYAGLVKWLRDKAESLSEIYPPEAEAADAIEAVLAERDALKDILPNQNHEGRAPIPTDWWGVAVLERRKRRAAEKERDALLARLAPVDDEALVDIAAETWIEATTGLARRPSAYTISERAGARAAIAAIRPHIEATERERLNGVIQSYQILLETQQRMFVDVQAERDGLAARLDFWISRR